MSDSEQWLFHQLRDQVRQALESMTGESVSAEEAQTAAREQLLWWEQTFSAGQQAKAWIGAPQSSWHEIGSRILRAAGIDDAGEAEVHSTYQEILSQALSGLSSAIGARIRAEVTCASGTEAAPPSGRPVIELVLHFEPGVPLALQVVFSEGLVAVLNPPAIPAPRDPRQSGNASRQDGVTEAVEASKTLDLLLEVELPVSVSFGRAQLRLKDVIKLSTGSIVELNRSVAEPVEIIVNNCVIARGEVVVLEGYYGVRIHQIISRQDRLRTLA